MKCPGCDMVCADRAVICPRCKVDLRPYREVLGLTSSGISTSEASQDSEEEICNDISPSSSQEETQTEASSSPKRIPLEFKSGLFDFRKYGSENLQNTLPSQENNELENIDLEEVSSGSEETIIHDLRSEGEVDSLNPTENALASILHRRRRKSLALYVDRLKKEPPPSKKRLAPPVISVPGKNNKINSTALKSIKERIMSTMLFRDQAKADLAEKTAEENALEQAIVPDDDTDLLEKSNSSSLKNIKARILSTMLFRDQSKEEEVDASPVHEDREEIYESIRNIQNQTLEDLQLKTDTDNGSLIESEKPTGKILPGKKGNEWYLDIGEEEVQEISGTPKEEEQEPVSVKTVTEEPAPLPEEDLPKRFDLPEIEMEILDEKPEPKDLAEDFVSSENPVVDDKKEGLSDGLTGAICHIEERTSKYDQFFLEVMAELATTISRDSVEMGTVNFFDSDQKEACNLFFDLCEEAFENPEKEESYAEPLTTEKEAQLDSGFLQEAFDAYQKEVREPVSTLRSLAKDSSGSPQSTVLAGPRLELLTNRERFYYFLTDFGFVVGFAVLGMLLYGVVLQPAIVAQILALQGMDPEDLAFFGGIFCGLFFSFLLIYPLCMYIFVGRTIGAMIFGSKVIKDNGMRIRFSNALVLALSFPLNLLFLGFIPVWFNKRAVNEHLARTYLVRKSFNR